MEDEFYGDTISVELAIQRELAYRRKLLHLNPNDDFLKDLIPLELESTTPSFDPIENQPSSSVVPSGSKRKEPEKQQSFTGSETLGISASTGDDLHCKLCNVECSSHFNLKQHLRGHKHRAKLEESAAKGQRQWCHICGVPCANEDCLKMHFDGKKHKAKVLELGLSAATGCGGQLVEHVPAEQRRGVYCDVCRVWCADEGCFKQHLEGRKHKLQIYDLHK